MFEKVTLTILRCDDVLERLKELAALHFASVCFNVEKIQQGFKRLRIIEVLLLEFSLELLEVHLFPDDTVHDEPQFRQKFVRLAPRHHCKIQFLHTALALK